MALSSKVLLPDSSGVDIVELDDKPRDFSVKIRQLVIKCLYQMNFHSLEEGSDVAHNFQAWYTHVVESALNVLENL